LLLDKEEKRKNVGNIKGKMTIAGVDVGSATLKYDGRLKKTWWGGGGGQFLGGGGGGGGGWGLVYGGGRWGQNTGVRNAFI